MNITDLIEAPSVVRPCVASPGTDPLRPGELPAPRVCSVFSADLAPGDEVLLGRRASTVETILRRSDGMISVRLADGSLHTCPPDAPWEVRRG